MRKSAQKITTLFTLSFLSLTSLSLPVLAGGHSKHLQKHLDPYRDDTTALMMVDLDLKTWLDTLNELMQDAKANVSVKVNSETSAEASPPENSESVEIKTTNSQDLMKMFDEFNQMAKDDLKIDLFWDVLLNLGSHLSAGYRPFPGRGGDLLVNLSLRSGDKASEVLNKLYHKAQGSDMDNRISRSKFADGWIYQLPVPDAEDEYKFVHLAVSKDQLLATIGPDDHQLKTMLYLGEVHPADSRFKLKNVPVFKAVKHSLQRQPIWFYTDAQGLVKLLEHVAADEFSSGDMAVLSSLASLYRGIGVGFKLHKAGIDFKSFLAPDHEQLSEFQKQYFKALQDNPGLKPEQAHIPGQAGFLSMSNHLDLSLAHPLPVDPALLKEADALKEMTPAAYQEVFQKYLNLNFKEDVLAALQGQVAFGVVQLPEQQEPQVVMSLGLKPDKAEAFEAAMASKFKVSLNELFGEEAPTITLEKAENYKDVQLYRFSQLEEVKSELGAWFDPVAARKGQTWIIAQTPVALKAAIDSPATQLPSFGPRPSADTQQLFYLDVPRVADWAKAAVGEDDPEINEMVEAVKAWKSLSGSSKVKPEGFEGQLRFEIDFKNKQLWQALGELVQEIFSEGSQELPEEMSEPDFSEDSDSSDTSEPDESTEMDSSDSVESSADDQE